MLLADARAAAPPCDRRGGEAHRGRPSIASDPPSFEESIARYEAWLRTSLGDLLVADDLRAKHRLMRQDPFLFLRGTCWRWAEIAAHACPALAEGPRVGSVGDAHVGNFGLWRDGEGRLVWGVNDFDEAARIPYRMDLARLVTSALLARGDDHVGDKLVAAAFDGYAAGIADPKPYVLEQAHGWLRRRFAATDAERAEFWARLRAAPPAPEVPAAYRAVLAAAAPAGHAPGAFSRRRAGVGSLGRPRFVMVTDDAGGPIAREAKAQLPSCWWMDAPAGAAFELGRSRYRCPDPYLALDGDISVRRLAPNSRKIDLNAGTRRVRRRLIAAMARDIGAIHAADGAAAAIETHLAEHGRSWLALAATAMLRATRADWHAYRRRASDAA